MSEEHSYLRVLNLKKNITRSIKDTKRFPAFCLDEAPEKRRRFVRLPLVSFLGCRGKIFRPFRSGGRKFHVATSRCIGAPPCYLRSKLNQYKNFYVAVLMFTSRELMFKITI